MLQVSVADVCDWLLC